ncbi:MAG: sigma 54-interacting transcriptional regulator [Sarcina sp.]
MEIEKREQIKITILASNIKMFEYYANLKDDRTDINVIVTHYKNQVEKVIKEFKDSTEIFIGLSDTAEYISKNTDIPVLALKLTNYDLIKTINDISDKKDKQIGLFIFEESKYDLDEIEKMFDLNKKILIYKYGFNSNLEDLIFDATKNGADIIVGEGVVADIAKKIGIPSKVIMASSESKNNIVKEAINIILYKRAELEKNIKLNAILNFINQGVIVTDESENIVLCNLEAKKILKKEEVDITTEKITNIISDWKLADDKTLEQTDGSEYLHRVNGELVATCTVAITSNGKNIGFVSSLEKASKIEKLEQKIRRQNSKKGLVAKYTFDDIITKNDKMEKMKTKVKAYAKTDMTVLINGESGTGKELVAQSIHNQSLRANEPFVAVNCAAIQENLLKSELFGYEGGAFTGAKKDGKIGLFELAHKGTIFLDEISEISKEVQASLLRVIQEKEVMRVGGTEVIPVDIRIICATNRNLKKAMLEGNFREDLYYRLNVFYVNIPPLRERLEDIILIARKYLDRYSLTNAEEKNVMKIIKNLPSWYKWYGNVRELENVILRIIFMVRVEDVDVSKVDYNSLIAELDYLDIDLSIEINGSLKEITSQNEKKVINALISKGYKTEEILEKLKISKASYLRKKNKNDT